MQYVLIIQQYFHFSDCWKHFPISDEKGVQCFLYGGNEVDPGAYAQDYANETVEVIFTGYPPE